MFIESRDTTGPDAHDVAVNLWRLGHRPALDGLRGLAVLLVMATHFTPDGWVRTGGSGVLIFFILSGFLITTLLLEELDRVGRISLSRFYGRRARRLLPALAVVTVVVAAISFAGGPLELEHGMLAAVALYVSNWYLIAAHPHGPIGPLGHTWSLAIEEQFYIVWPLVLVWLLRRHRTRLRGVVAALAAAALAWSVIGTWVVHRPGIATDMLAWYLLAGCSLAVLMHGRATRQVRTWPALGLVLVIPAAMLPESWDRLQVLWIPAVAVAAIWVGAQTRVWWLELPWLRWVGVRSYGLYLIHFPVSALCSMLVGPWPVTSAIGVAVSVGLAALSWRLVESPFLRRGASNRANGKHALEPVVEAVAS